MISGRIKSIRVLIIANDSVMAAIIKLLSERTEIDYQVETVGTLTQGLINIVLKKYDIILLNLILPDSKGVDAIGRIIEKNSHCPIVILTDEEDKNLAARTVQFGAQDYLVHNRLDSYVLSRVIYYAIEKKKLEEKINHLAYIDQLTGLPNRALFKKQLNKILKSASRHQHMFALLYLDLDNFKMVNDSHGHEIGDRLLKDVSEVIKKSIRQYEILVKTKRDCAIDMIYRVGGDEFIIILPEIKNAHNATLVANRLISAFSKEFYLDDMKFFLTVSIGIAIYPFDGHDVDTIFKNADLAMYHAKKNGKNVFQYYKSQMNITAVKRMNLANDLRKALERKEFFVNYQPIMNMITGELTDIEALIRWQPKGNGVVFPNDFISYTEESNLIIPIGEWYLNEVCNQFQQWQKLGLKSLPVSINLSIRQFKQKNLIDQIIQILKNLRISAEFLKLEITESLFMDNEEDVIRMLKKINDFGCKILIDDFGVGYSSLNRLKKLPLSALKIDQSFIKNIPVNESDNNIVSGIIAMGHSLKLAIIAEGVETNEQFGFLKSRNCDAIQGYILSPPLYGQDIAELLYHEGNGAGIGHDLLDILNAINEQNRQDIQCNLV